MQNHSKHRTGFTLVELLVVLTILGIIIAMAAPSFSDWLKRIRIEGTANEFIALVQLARSEAIKRNAPVYLQTSRTNDTTWTLLVSDKADACDVDAACDLKHLISSEQKQIKLRAISEKLNGTAINPVDSLFNFAAGETNAQQIELAIGEDDYLLNVRVTVTGITSICIPASAKEIKGYPTCT